MLVIRVLVAEDHTIVREGIKQLIGLAKDLLVVGEASNGEQLLVTLRHVPCEVVLLDISMPGWSVPAQGLLDGAAARRPYRSAGR